MLPFLFQLKMIEFIQFKKAVQIDYMVNEIFFLGLRIEIWALFLSIVALVFTLLKDFITPWVFKPKLEFNYEEKPPYRRQDVIINRNQELRGAFLRFSVKNVGRRPALNCRCQILKVEKENNLYGDYQGFPLRWASRPESVINQVSGERLNIARRETEFVDLAVTTNKDNFIHLQKYHNVDIGIKEVIENGKYDIYLIFSGDNFNPYILKFMIERKNSIIPNDVKLILKNSSP